MDTQRTTGLSALGLCLALSLLMTACAGLQKPVEVTAGPSGEAVMKVQARSFAFEPNHLQAKQGDLLVLEVQNVSSLTHNITIEDPQGRIVQSVDLPSDKTTRVEVRLAEAGSYPFYCDKPLHAALGMKGVIEVR